MIVQCDKCGSEFEDEYRTYVCPHEAFPANDGNNNFTVHEESHLVRSADGSVYNEDYFLRGKESGKSLYTNYQWLPELTIPMVRAIAAHCGIQKQDRILDFGCARGYVVRAFREEGYDAWGIDISEWAIRNADDGIKPYLNWCANGPCLVAKEFDWVIAKDVLEHVEAIDETVDTLKVTASKGIFAVVPLAHGREYDVPEYEKDVTHIHRRPLQWWVSHFHQAGWSVEARYRVNGVKDNYAHYSTGNGFITARRL